MRVRRDALGLVGRRGVLTQGAPEARLPIRVRRELGQRVAADERVEQVVTIELVVVEAGAEAAAEL